MAARIGDRFSTSEHRDGNDANNTAVKIVQAVGRILVNDRRITERWNHQVCPVGDKELQLVISFGGEKLITEVAALLPIITHYQTFKEIAIDDQNNFIDAVASRLAIELLNKLMPEHGVSSISGTSIHVTIRMVPLPVDQIRKVLREAAMTAMIYNQYFDSKGTPSALVDDSQLPGISLRPISDSAGENFGGRDLRGVGQIEDAPTSPDEPELSASKGSHDLPLPDLTIPQTSLSVVEARKEQLLSAMQERGCDVIVNSPWQQPLYGDVYLLNELSQIPYPNGYLLKQLPEEDLSRCRDTRYRPYDKKRVELSDGTFIDASPHPAGFIQASHPLANTVDRFWQMIWEQNSSLIVMFTNPKDDPKNNCYPYWPTSGEQHSAGITIKFQREESHNQNLYSAWTVSPFNYTVRTFELSRNGEERTVHQLEFTTPSVHYINIAEFSNMIKAARLQQSKLDEQAGAILGPTVVHCSTGSGHTASFCAGMVIAVAHENDLRIWMKGLFWYSRSVRPFSKNDISQCGLVYNYAIYLGPVEK